MRQQTVWLSRGQGHHPDPRAVLAERLIAPDQCRVDQVAVAMDIDVGRDLGIEWHANRPDAGLVDGDCATVGDDRPVTKLRGSFDGLAGGVMDLYARGSVSSQANVAPGWCGTVDSPCV
jgi:hypothetical protein